MDEIPQSRFIIDLKEFISKCNSLKIKAHTINGGIEFLLPIITELNEMMKEFIREAYKEKNKVEFFELLDEIEKINAADHTAKPMEFIDFLKSLTLEFEDYEFTALIKEYSEKFNHENVVDL